MKAKSNVFMILTSVFPALMYLYGMIKLFLLGDIVNNYHLIVFVVFPLLWGALSALFAYVVRHKVLKVLYVIALLPITCFAMILLSLIHREMIVRYDRDTFESREQEITSEFYNMPEIDEMGEYENLEYYHYKQIYSVLFMSDVHTVVCQYSEEEYEAQKAYVEENYVFRTDDYRDLSRQDGEYYLPPTAEIDGFTFRYLDESSYGFYHPKYVVLIGMNDETLEIAYIDFYDIDLDYFSPLDEFILNECGWEHISDVRSGIPARFAIFVDIWRRITV